MTSNCTTIWDARRFGTRRQYTPSSRAGYRSRWRCDLAARGGSAERALTSLTMAVAVGCVTRDADGTLHRRVARHDAVAGPVPPKPVDFSGRDFGARPGAERCRF